MPSKGDTQNLVPTFRVRVNGSGTVLVTLQAGAWSSDLVVAGSASPQSVATDALDSLVLDREILGVEQVGGDQVDLTKASTIVAVGRGGNEMMRARKRPRPARETRGGKP